MSSTEPWKEKGSIWKSKSAYYAWLRGQIRRAWTRYPVKNAFLREKRFKSVVGQFKNGKDKVVWCGNCDVCLQDFKLGELAVDHIDPAGSLNSPEDLESFVTKLFCSYDNMQLICKPCHIIKSYSDKYGITDSQSVAGIEAGKIKRMTPTSKLQGYMVKKMSATPEDIKNKDARESFINNYYKVTWLK